LCARGDRCDLAGPRIHPHHRRRADDGEADDRGIQIAVGVGRQPVDDLQQGSAAATLGVPGRPSVRIGMRAIRFCSVLATYSVAGGTNATPLAPIPSPRGASNGWRTQSAPDPAGGKRQSVPSSASLT
jgi:hypothetical protein